MSTPDDFSPYVADLLSGTYDCVDRISVRGYFPLGQTSGGLLTWWNQLFPNTQLSEQQLRKLAGDFARRVHAFARKHKIALRYFAIGDKTKHPKPRNFAPPIPSSEGKQSRKASDVCGVSTANVAQIIQWDWNGGDSLCWLCARVAENR